MCIRDSLYTWTTSNGNIVSGAITLNPIVDSPGDYNLLVTDVQTGCTSESTVTVTENISVPSISNIPTILPCGLTSFAFASNSICPNCTIEVFDPNGIQVCNGVPCTFTTINGTYNFTVTDNSNGCSNSGDFTIMVNDLELSSVVTDVLCFGDAGGSIDLTVVAGSGAYSFLWTTSDQSEDLSGVFAGTYLSLIHI